MPNQCRPPPPFTRIIDTGTSHHNLTRGDGNPQQYVPYAANTPPLMKPNGANITAQARYNLHLRDVSRQASELDILPSFKHSLLSVGRLCNDDCTAIFLNRNAQYITNKANQSSQASEIITWDYMNNRSQQTTITTSTRQMPHYQHPTYRNT